MLSNVVSLRRILALSVAITVLAAPVASAQSRGATFTAVPANQTLLNKAAFARLATQPAVVTPTRVVADAPRPSLLRQVRAQAASTKVPEKKSWSSQHPGAVGGIIIGAIVGAIGIGLVVRVRAE